ncbi:anoctamin-9 isoform X3 [Bos javanicus]|uniref:anoctamin-9 isoform X3 n=1 Tax=Bos javanicus TaxID=9906 RepID=UPI002AA6282F|nr:anoctamin-9 isoform X3 [Bos javanicus]XP_061263575.1 anoctamin-9 isoform X3 [Bos javanicus]
MFAQGEESLRILVPTEGESLPLMDINTCETEAPELWDYVFVVDRRTQRNLGQVQRQRQFLEKLENQGFRYKAMEDQEKEFFGIRADNRMFDRYWRLTETEDTVPRGELSRPASIRATNRIRIVDFVLNSKMAAGDTLQDLVKDGVFEAGFPLHKGEEHLKKKWARWRSMFQRQPISDIRDYFGEKVALYFAWLGWYTYMLVPAAVIGLIVFLSGFSQFEASQISKEICKAHDIYMCPRGDHNRRFQRLSDTCAYAKLTHLFDNEGTVLFAIFMALWATVFLELWKRERARVVLQWELYGWDEDQEEMALGLISCPDYQPQLHQHSYLRSTVILLLSLLMICLMIGMAHVLVVYRVLAAALFNSALPFLGEQVTTAVVVSGALVHYVIILIMTKINKYVALKLCDFEKPRTFSERESKFTIKFFTLQFFAHFSSLIYIAFILGRQILNHCATRGVPDTPVDDQRSPREDGAPGGAVEAGGVPPQRLHDGPVRADGHHHGSEANAQQLRGVSEAVRTPSPPGAAHRRESGPQDAPPPAPPPAPPGSPPASPAPRWLAHKCRSLRAPSQDPELGHWQRNYRLNPVYTFSLFNEFMEMMIQYGFTTIFVAAFPLAPLLALFSNLVEIRLDAIKMVRLQRRLVPRKAKDIGTWLQVLEIIGVLAVIANGMVIAFTSEFIPRVVYKYCYGPCRRGAQSEVDCFTGYVNHSLSVFYTKDFQDPAKIEGWENVTECRYRDYFSAQDSNFSEQQWFLLAIRLAFLILFEHVALCIKLIAAWFVPDVPQSVKNEVLKKKYQRLEEKSCSPKSTDV